MGIQIPSGLLHYFFQRSVVRKFSVDDSDADENLKAQESGCAVFHTRRTSKGNAGDHRIHQSICGRSWRDRGVWAEACMSQISNYANIS